MTVFSPGHVDMWLGPATRHVLNQRHGSLEGIEIVSINGEPLQGKQRPSSSLKGAWRTHKLTGTMVASLLPKKLLPAEKRTVPTFDVQRQRLLDGLRALGWAVVSGLKVPHASMGDSRLWFKTQAVYLNDLGTDPRNFAHTHSLVSDIRELKDATQLQEQVLRMRLIQRRDPR